MKFYDSAKQSMDIENMLVKVMNEHSVAKEPQEAFQLMEPGENVYEISVEVKQIWPPL